MQRGNYDWIQCQYNMKKLKYVIWIIDRVGHGYWYSRITVWCQIKYAKVNSGCWYRMKELVNYRFHWSCCFFWHLTQCQLHFRAHNFVLKSDSSLTHNGLISIHDSMMVQGAMDALKRDSIKLACRWWLNPSTDLIMPQIVYVTTPLASGSCLVPGVIVLYSMCVCVNIAYPGWLLKCFVCSLLIWCIIHQRLIAIWHVRYIRTRMRVMSHGRLTLYCNWCYCDWICI